MDYAHRAALGLEPDARTKRLKKALQVFDSLPALALINIDVVCALSGRSPASVWRDSATGKLPSPVRMGRHSTRWRAGDIRQALAAAKASVVHGRTRSSREVA